MIFSICDFLNILTSCDLTWPHLTSCVLRWDQVRSRPDPSHPDPPPPQPNPSWHPTQSTLTKSDPTKPTLSPDPDILFIHISEMWQWLNWGPVSSTVSGGRTSLRIFNPPNQLGFHTPKKIVPDWLRNTLISPVQWVKIVLSKQFYIIPLNIWYRNHFYIN